MKNKYHYDNNFTIEPKELGDLLLYQLGEMMCDNDTIVEPHVHLDWFEFTYVFSGAGTIFTNNVAKDVEKGDIYVSFPREIHKIVSSNTDPMRYCFFAFNFTHKEKSSYIIDALMKYKDLANRIIKVPHYESYLTNALTYITWNNELFKDKLLEYELLTLILRVAHKSAKYNDQYHPPKANNIQTLTFNIVNYIDTNLTTIKDISQLAEVFNYNYSYLSRCFKKCMNISVSEFFNDKKLNIAKKMLEAKDLSITEISQSLNYSTIYVFSRAFKNKYGISPKKYRDNQNK